MMKLEGLERIDWTAAAAIIILLIYFYFVISQWRVRRNNKRTGRAHAHALTSAERIALSDLYHETCDTIKTMDDISLKLLAFVPLFAATSSGLLAKNTVQLSSPVTRHFAIVGMLVTIALYVWERRNIQTCNFFRDRRDDLEERLGFKTFGDERRPILFGVSLGKTEAEDLLYAAGLLFWLIPFVATLS